MMDREETLDVEQIMDSLAAKATESQKAWLISALLRSGISTKTLDDLDSELLDVHEDQRLLEYINFDDNFKQIAGLAKMPVVFCRWSEKDSDPRDVQYDIFSIGYKGTRQHLLRTDFEVETNEIMEGKERFYTKTVSLIAQYRGLTAVVASELYIEPDKRQVSHLFGSNKSPKNQEWGSETRVGLRQLLRLVWEDMELDPLEDERDQVRSLMKLIWGPVVEVREFEDWGDHPTILDIAVDEISQSQTWDFEKVCWVVDEPE
jgi:hypothetical protein